MRTLPIKVLEADDYGHTKDGYKVISVVTNQVYDDLKNNIMKDDKINDYIFKARVAYDSNGDWTIILSTEKTSD